MCASSQAVFYVLYIFFGRTTLRLKASFPTPRGRRCRVLRALRALRALRTPQDEVACVPARPCCCAAEWRATRLRPLRPRRRAARGAPSATRWVAASAARTAPRPRGAAAKGRRRPRRGAARGSAPQHPLPRRPRRLQWSASKSLTRRWQCRRALFGVCLRWHVAFGSWAQPLQRLTLHSTAARATAWRTRCLSAAARWRRGCTRRQRSCLPPGVRSPPRTTTQRRCQLSYAPPRCAPATRHATPRACVRVC